MLGILVALLISGLVLYFVEGKSLMSLGFSPAQKRLQQFLTGFLAMVALCFVAQYLDSFVKSSTWVLNEEWSISLILQSLFWDAKSVLTEELIFRGALLYILLNKLGRQKGLLISAVAFGVYHWFSFGVLGNLLPMIFVFIGTGLMGYAWALAFAKTRSIMLPFGLHLGWNFTHNTIFSKGPLGEMLLISQGGNELSDWPSLFNALLSMVLIPLLGLAYVHFFVGDDKEVL